MPCWARESTSLIALLFSAVIPSSSFTRSRIGTVKRCTYFLLANGCVTRFTKFGSSPSQKSLLLGGCSGSLLAVCEAGGTCPDCGALELVCCADPGIATAADKSSAANICFFIGPPASGERLHPSQMGVLRDT